MGLAATPHPKAEIRSVKNQSGSIYMCLEHRGGKFFSDGHFTEGRRHFGKSASDPDKRILQT